MAGAHSLPATRRRADVVRVEHARAEVLRAEQFRADLPARHRAAHRADDRARPFRPNVRRPDIQGLRCVAVALVVLFHAGVPWLQGGYVGVDVFFVISGFLITGIITRGLEVGTFHMPAFWAGRARRLLPAAFVAIAFTCLLSYLVLPASRFDDIARDGLASGYYGLNWRMANQAVDYLNMGAAPSPFQHFWSLGVEEQFYLLWPPLLAFVAFVARSSRSRHRMSIAFGAVLLAVFVPSLWYSINYTAHDAARAYFVTPTRMWELALGGGVALSMAVARRISPQIGAVLGWAGLALIAWSAIWFDTSTAFPGTAALVPTVGAAAVLAFGEQSLRYGPAALLRLRPFTFVGDISYSLYLWHWPLIVFAAHLWFADAIKPWPMLLVGMASIVPAYLSYRFVERPVLRAPRFATNVAGLRIGFFATAASLIVAALLLTEVPGTSSTLIVSANGRAVDINGQTHKIGAETLPTVASSVPPSSATSSSRSSSTSATSASSAAQAVRAASADQPQAITPDPVHAITDIPDNGGCIQPFAATTDLRCTFGDQHARTTIELVGDSHAMQWLPAAQAAAQRYHWKIITHVKQACPFAQGDFFLREEPNGECEQWNDAAMKAIIAEKPTLVITSGKPYGMYFDGYDHDQQHSVTAMADAYRAAWQQLQDARIPVAVLADTPMMGYDVVGCVEQHTKHLGTCDRPRSSVIAATSGLEMAAHADPHVSYVDLNSQICPAARCSPVIGDVLVYRDDHHITATYAATLGDAFGTAFAKLLKV